MGEPKRHRATIFSRLGVMTACSDMVEIDSHECYLSVACHYHVPPIGGGAPQSYPAAAVRERQAPKQNQFRAKIEFVVWCESHKSHLSSAVRGRDENALPALR